MDRKNKGFSARKPNTDSAQSFHPNKSKLVSNNSSFHAPKSAKGRAEDIFSEKKRFNESSDTLKYKNNKKKNNKSQIFSEKSFDESSSSLMSFREDDQDPPMKFRSVKNKVETGKILPQSKKIKKQIPKTPSTEDDLPQDVSPKKRKTQWTSDADAQVIKLLAELGPKWTEIGKIMGGRSGKQVRDRYLQKLRPDISFEKWTEEEDALVIALYKKYGHKWSQIASEVKTRSESQIKNRFNTRLKRLINKKPQKNSHRQMEEEADQEQEEEEEQEQEEEMQQQDDEEEEEDLGGPLSPLVRAESLAKLENDKQPHRNVELVDFEEIFLKKSMRLPSFQKLTSVSIKKQNSAIAQEFRGQAVNYSSLFNSGSQPHHILPDFHHHRSKHDF